MGTKQKKPPDLILVYLLIFFISSCKPTCIPDKFSFLGGTVLFTPEKDSARIGDTIWVNVHLPKQYVFGSKNVDLSAASNMVSQINFSANPQLDSIADAVDSFTFLSGQGQFLTDPLNSHGQININYIEGDSIYFFSMGIIPQRKGIYILTTLDLFQAEKKCIKAKIGIHVLNPDPHLHYLDGIYHPGSPYAPAPSEMDLTHDYCFKVY
jgi:hypothetical protein